MTGLRYSAISVSYGLKEEKQCPGLKTDPTGVKLQTALAPGLTAASLCINRRLASIAMSRAVSSTHNKKRLNLAIDLSLGVGLPVILMALSYIVQPHRYDIFEGFGCEGAVYLSTPAIFIIYLMPIVLGIISAVYGGELLHSCRTRSFGPKLTSDQESPSLTSCPVDSSSLLCSGLRKAVWTRINIFDWSPSRPLTSSSAYPSTSSS